MPLPEAAVFDAKLRQFVYRYLVREGKAPKATRIATGLRSNVRTVRAGLERMAQSHALVLQEDGEIWRAAPFSAVPTAFVVEAGRRRWYGNCIWDALGIPAMLHQDARIHAACGCCNFELPITVKHGKVAGGPGVIHFAVPARRWYDDIVFT